MLITLSPAAGDAQTVDQATPLVARTAATGDDGSSTYRAQFSGTLPMTFAWGCTRNEAHTGTLAIALTQSAGGISGTASLSADVIVTPGTCDPTLPRASTFMLAASTSGSATSYVVGLSFTDVTPVAFSRHDPATVPFTDVSFVSGLTTIKAAHVLELRNRINAQLVRRGQPAYAFTNPIAAGTTITAVDLLELYSAVNTALVAAGQQTVAVPELMPRVTVATASHIDTLRTAVLTLEGL